MIHLPNASFTNTAGRREKMWHVSELASPSRTHSADSTFYTAPVWVCQCSFFTTLIMRDEGVPAFFFPTLMAFSSGCGWWVGVGDWGIGGVGCIYKLTTGNSPVLLRFCTVGHWAALMNKHSCKVGRVILGGLKSRGKNPINFPRCNVMLVTLNTWMGMELSWMNHQYKQIRSTLK